MMDEGGGEMTSSGDFDAFFLAGLSAALRLAQRITGDRTSAEDVAAEAFARAFAHWDRVGSLAYREAWVLKVASNLAIDLVRRRRPALPSARPERDPAGQVALRLTLVQAVRSLPRAQREALVLRYLADLSEAEVAAALGVSDGTVKSHVHRAREALRSRLGTDPEELGYGTSAP
jgi:RNA polymerase sigma-70 factor (ECF subfamily)